MSSPSKIPYLLHVPKTGGRAVRSILGKLSICCSNTPGKMGHSVIEKSKESYGFDYLNPARLPQNLYNVFTVVRNPYSLLLSHYNHRGFGWCNARERMGVSTFEDFIKMYCDGSFWSPQLNDNLFFQLYTSTGRYFPQTTLYQETLNKDLAKLLYKMNWIGSVKDLPKADPTEAYEGNEFSMPLPNEADYRTRYTNEMRYLVEKKCSKELKAFGYDFNGRV